MDEKQSPLSYQFAMMNVRNSSPTNKKSMHTNDYNGDEQNQFNAGKSKSKSTTANNKTKSNDDSNKMVRLKNNDNHTSSPGRRKFTDNVCKTNNVNDDQSNLKYSSINYHLNEDIDDSNIQENNRSRKSSITISLTDNVEQEQKKNQRKTSDNIEPVMDHLDTAQETFSLSSPSPLSSATNTTNEEQINHYSKKTSINSSSQLHQNEQERKQEQQITKTNENVSLKQSPNKRIRKKTTTATTTTTNNIISNDNKQCCCCNCCQNSQTLSKTKKNVQQQSKQSSTSPNAPKWNKQTSANSMFTESATLTKEPLTQVLITLKDQNKNLIKEIEDLRIKLEDAEG